MVESQGDLPRILSLYLQITQYPVLARRIRERMREELFRRGVITPERLEAEAKEKAVQSQFREGLSDPFGEESEHIWQGRLQQIRDYLTDFYFAYNLPMDLFHRIVEELLSGRRRTGTGELRAGYDATTLTFNPELAPIELLIRKIEQYEAMHGAERERVGHHLEEMRVVLIKALISDQLSFVGLAKKWLDADDFKFILERRIGSGKIGGKAAGMLLAWKILQSASSDLGQIAMPRSYFIGADVFYDYLAVNKVEYINQKYKPVEQIRDDYPKIQAEYEQGRFPDDIAEQLRQILREVGDTPLIVRSSSLLEDNFGTSFAGKYHSYFCPNQGTLKENMRDLSLAIRRIYASVYSPDALIYRRRMGLVDYDERMAILLQEVQGERWSKYFFPTLAGVAFSRSPIVWSPRLRREEGFVRLVLGLGTRAVDRVGEDYARLIFLSHPQLRPEKTPAEVEHYSQRLLDALDLESNLLVTIPANETLALEYVPLRWVASLRDDGTLLPIKSLGPRVTPHNLVLTFDGLIQKTDFVAQMKTILTTLAQNYGFPVDVEFTASLTPDPSGGKPWLKFCVLQCRPQALARGELTRPIPREVAEADKVFFASRMVPYGQIENVEYVLYVQPELYPTLNEAARHKLARLIGSLNKQLEGKAFILLGPGRWGSSNTQLGVPVTYADIYNARALVELAVQQGANGTPDPSYGTHFFQDLVESNIYPLAVYPDEPTDTLNWPFLQAARNQLLELAPEAVEHVEVLKVIRVPAERPGYKLDVLMDSEKALAYFVKEG